MDEIFCEVFFWLMWIWNAEYFWVKINNIIGIPTEHHVMNLSMGNWTYCCRTESEPNSDQIQLAKFWIILFTLPKKYDSISMASAGDKPGIWTYYGLEWFTLLNIFFIGEKKQPRNVCSSKFIQTD